MGQQTQPGNKHTVQNILNWSFDSDFNTLGVGIVGYDSDAGVLRRIKVNSDGEIVTNLETGDIEIGAVEIKNSTDDTRATVGADGLHTEVRKSVLPEGAATSAKQDTQTTLLQGIAGMIPSAYDTVIINYTDSTKVTVSSYIFKLGVATVATITPTSAATSDTYTKT